MGLLPGARELGLEVCWRHQFVGFGFRAQTTPGVVFVDVGGRLQPGVLDHHAGEKADTCASAVVLGNREAVYNHLLGPWLERLPCGGIAPGARWSPTMVTHKDPDWDALVACYLVERLVEDGDFPPFAEALVAYALEVDQGRYRLDAESEDSRLAPHMGYLALQSREGEGACRTPSRPLVPTRTSRPPCGRSRCGPAPGPWTRAG